MSANCSVSSTYGPSDPWIRAAGVVFSIPKFPDEPEMVVGHLGFPGSSMISSRSPGGDSHVAVAFMRRQGHLRFVSASRPRHDTTAVETGWIRRR